MSIGLISTASTMLNIAVQAPMPIARVEMAASVSAGSFASRRMASPTSFPIVGAIMDRYSDSDGTDLNLVRVPRVVLAKEILPVVVAVRRPHLRVHVLHSREVRI